MRGALAEYLAQWSSASISKPIDQASTYRNSPSRSKGLFKVYSSVAATSEIEVLAELNGGFLSPSCRSVAMCRKVGF